MWVASCVRLTMTRERLALPPLRLLSPPLRLILHPLPIWPPPLMMTALRSVAPRLLTMACRASLPQRPL